MHEKLLDPRVVTKILPLELRARRIVEGFLGGLHRSPYRGVSVEFAEHREYVPGDDIRFLDWKVFGRSDRYYVKEFEVETDLCCHFFLDTSESMKFSSEEVSKFNYGATLVSALSYLTLHQGDASSLVFFDEGVGQMIPPGRGAGHLKIMLDTLQNVNPTKKTATGASLHALAERLQRKGIVIILSDLFDELDSVLSGLEHLRHNGHEILLFHLLDRAEHDFPYDRMTLFEGMEGMPNLVVDAKDLQTSYLKELRGFNERIRKACLQQQIDYSLFLTDQALDAALIHYLSRRASHSKGRNAR